MENVDDKKNIYIDEETGEDIAKILEDKRIHASKKVEKLRKNKGIGNDYRDFPEDEKFTIDWGLVGFWYAFGISYMNDLGKEFKHYMFKKSGRRYLYEVIPTKRMKILKVGQDLDLSFKEVLEEYDGAEYNREIDYLDVGCIWNLEKGFILRPLYFCTDHKCIDKEKDIWEFKFRKLNKPDLVF